MDVMQFLDGKHYVLDGVSGVFKIRGTHPAQTLEHVPDEDGMDSEEYQRIRRELGDDYVTDLTENITRYCTIALKLGWKERA